MGVSAGMPLGMKRGGTIKVPPHLLFQRYSQIGSIYSLLWNLNNPYAVSLRTYITLNIFQIRQILNM